MQKLLSGRGRSSSVLPLIAVAISTILVIAFITAGSDVAILVILAFVVLAVVLSKQRQDGRPSTDPTAAPARPDASTPPQAHLPCRRRIRAGCRPPTGPARIRPPASAPWPGDPYAVPATSAEVSRGTAPPAKRERQASWLGFVTLAVAAVVGGVMVAVGVPDDSGTGVPAIAATVLVIIGLGLVVGTWAGRSRGLIAWGILTTLVLVAIATFVPAARRHGSAHLGSLDRRRSRSRALPPRRRRRNARSQRPRGRARHHRRRRGQRDGGPTRRGRTGGCDDRGQRACRHGPPRTADGPQRRVDRGGFNVSADYTDTPDTSRPPTETESPDSTTEEPAGRIVLDLEVGLGELEVRRATASR